MNGSRREKDKRAWFNAAPGSAFFLLGQFVIAITTGSDPSVIQNAYLGADDADDDSEEEQSDPEG